MLALGGDPPATDFLFGLICPNEAFGDPYPG